MADTRGLYTSKSWRYASYAIASIVVAPVLVIFASWLLPISSEHWSHLSQYILKEVIINTFALLLGVGILTACFGTLSAWICSQYEFPGAKFFRRAMLFPFAIPAYVNAFVYVGLLDYAGPFRTFLRNSPLGDTWVPEIRSLSAGIVLLSLSLYPYVYALSYNAFQSQGRSLNEAARSLGHSPLSSFFRLSLPYAKPWIIGGVCLVGLEVLNDFGTVSVIGIQSFTTAIYKAWFAFFSPETAAQLSSVLILLAFAIYSWDQHAKKLRDYKNTSAEDLPRKIALKYGLIATAFCVLLLAFAFVIPLTQIILWSLSHAEDFLAPEWRASFLNSILLGLAAATLTSVAACILVFAKRASRKPSVEMSYKFAQLGYGIPGSVIAVGAFIPLAYLDRSLVAGLESLFGYEGGLILTGTIFSMTIALMIRFLAVSSSSLDAGMGRIPPSYDEAASIYGIRGLALLLQVHWPLLRNSFAAGFLLSFVDIIKEMPLTLMTRPFGWDTLSVRIYSFISEGEWQRASVPALGLILIGILPLLFFSGRKS